MEYQIKAESGLQLLARLSSRPSLSGLNDILFPKDIKPEDVVEISGESGVGKTMLISQLLVKCLLPKSWQDIDIGGLGAGAVIIDTDHHFQLLTLVNKMESWLIKCQKADDLRSSEETKWDSNTIEKIVTESLTNLTILSCHDSTQLFITFHSLGNLLSSNMNISLLIIDSISAYYWQDAMIGRYCRIDYYLKKLIKMLQSCIQQCKVTVIYTKHSFAYSKTSTADELSSKSVLDNATYRIQLRTESNSVNDVFSAEINAADFKHIQQYIITSEGLKWVNG